MTAAVTIAAVIMQINQNKMLIIYTQYSANIMKITKI